MIFFWIEPVSLSDDIGEIPHPYVLIQDNVIHRSRIKTVVMCALTSNIKRVDEPGNVLFDVDKANLPLQCIVVVSQIETVNKPDLKEYIGTLILMHKLG